MAELQCVDCGKTHPPRTALAPSRFRSLIDSTALPTSFESASVRDLLRQTDEEIASRKRSIDRLLCEVAELRRRSEQHKFIVAPIRRVPPEVMGEIFMQLAAIERHCYSLTDYSEKLVGPQDMVQPFSRRAPLIFGQIAREWRAIALSIPGLWNSIALHCRSKKDLTNIHLCNTWLQRSGSLPLSIRLYRSYVQEDPTSQNIRACQDLVRIILPFAKRWRSLELRNLPASSYDVLHELLPESAPLLQSLSIEHCDDPIPPTQFAPWTRFCVAPKLRLLYFDSINGANVATLGEPTFPWSQLTHIDVGDCSAYDCLAILGQASMAVACKFVINKPSFLQHPSVSHFRLQTLKVDAYDTSLPLWTGLTCSVLSTFSLDSKSSGLPSFLSRSGQVIEDFTLMGSNLDATQFLSCLTSMPRLRRLEVSEHGDGSQFTGRVWESLTGTPTQGFSPLIPNLESLDLAGGTQFSHRSVVRFLKSRVQKVVDFAPLKDLRLSIWRPMSESVHDRLMTFGKLGLKIQVEVVGDSEEDSGSEASDTEDEDDCPFRSRERGRFGVKSRVTVGRGRK
ncbi:hypothetical protein DFH06DRAFT_1073438 [Mycena polygramma]|nr:hypothetical protein DFH06DRAFT_1073438 [Mycena polygramma]